MKSQCLEWQRVPGLPSKISYGTEHRIRQRYCFAVLPRASALPAARSAECQRSPRRHPLSRRGQKLLKPYWCFRHREQKAFHFSLTVPLKTVRTPCKVRTSRKPRSSRPSVVPSTFKPFSSMRTSLPRAHDDCSVKRLRIERRASFASINRRYSRSSDFSKAAVSSTRDHSLPVASRNE